MVYNNNVASINGTSTGQTTGTFNYLITVTSSSTVASVTGAITVIDRPYNFNNYWRINGNIGNVEEPNTSVIVFRVRTMHISDLFQVHFTPSI